MPIPDFDPHGLLPVGVHDCTLEEVAARFGVFRGNEQRPRLMAKLEAFITEARGAGFARWVLVDGSFVTAQPNPNDIDLVLVLPATHDDAADLPPMQYNLVSRRRVRSRHGFDLLVAAENTSEYDQAVAFFAQVRGQRALRKGLLRILL